MNNTIDMQDIYEIVRYALDRDDLETIDPETHLYKDLHMDSMGAVAMVVEIERLWGLRIPDDLISKLMTPKSYLDVVLDLNGAAA